MGISNSDLKFYLTSIEPGVTQPSYAQSLGGYPSLSLVYPNNTTFSSCPGLYGTNISSTLSSPSSVANNAYLGSEAEIIQYNSNTNVSRGANGIYNTHESGSIVYGMNEYGLFSNRFSDEWKQYRCICLYNANPTYSAYNVKLYIKQNSNNPDSNVKMALEIPENGVTINPAQRIPAGTVSPVFGTARVTSLQDAQPYAPISINVNGNRSSGTTLNPNTLNPNDVIYIWLERAILKDSEEFGFNNIIITVNYTTA